VLGGVKEPEHVATAEVWRLNTLTNTWSAGTALPEPRMNAPAAAYEGHLVITGGVNFPGFTPYMTTKIFDGTSWVDGAAVPDSGGLYSRWSYAAYSQTAGGDLWIAGGRRDADWAVLDHTGVLFAANDTWVTSPALPELNQARVYTSGTIAPDGNFYTAGGRDNDGEIIYSTFEMLRVGGSPAGTADFSVNVTQGIVPLAVAFTDQSSGSPTAWRWDFGDGGTSTQQNPVHVYSIPGNYTVTLDVTWPTGSDQVTRADYIHAQGEEADYYLSLEPGWNFVSTPRRLASGHDTASIFINVDTAGHSIWQYDASGRRWTAMIATTRVRVLDGIWIYSNVSEEVGLHFLADPVDTPPEKTCYQGWNAIGFPDITPTSAKDTLISIRPDWTTLIGYDAGLQRYEDSIINGGSGIHSDTNLMNPGKGYWLFMINDGVLSAISA